MRFSMTVHEDKITHILLAHCERLKKLPRVAGVCRGFNKGAPCIILKLNTPRPPGDTSLPESLEGIPVLTEVIGGGDDPSCP